MKIKEDLSGPFISVPIVIHFGDTDPYGVVYFASYFRYCHHGIEAFMKSLGLPPHKYFRNREKGFGLPDVGASCDFYKPVWYGDELVLKVFVKEMRRKSITFGFAFYKKDSDELVAQGYATIVSIDKSWKACNLPEDLRLAVKGFLDSGS